MRKLMDKYGKALMAIFGVMLMLIYLLPNGSKNGMGRSESVHGHMGTQVIYASDMQRYRNEWDFLTRNAFVPMEQYGSSTLTWVPITRLLSPDTFNELLANKALGEPDQEQTEIIDHSLQQLQQHSDMYALLVMEAHRMNVSVSRDQLEALLRKIGTFNEDHTAPIPFSECTDPDRVEGITACLTNFLLVQNAFARAASAIKTSEPLTQYEVATRQQEISLQMVEFTDAAYLPTVPVPTQEQMQAQFQKYSDINPLAADLRTDPFGFGYKYPNRIKLQYINVPRTAIEGAALRARNQNDQTRYEWDIAAFRYYQAHQSLYPTSQPSSSSLSLSQASVRPFKDVNLEARQGVLHDDADKLALSIRQKINSQMAADYLAWKNAGGSGHSPPTSLGVAYDSADYLPRLALMIQKNFGVLPTTTEPGQWQTRATLDSLPGISAAVVDDPDFPALPFAEYAIDEYAGFVTPGSPAASHAFALYEPSVSLKSEANDFYVFRISAAEVSHTPASMTEVADQIRRDLQSQAAYNLAEAEAKKFLASAQSSHSISSAPRPADKSLIAAGPIDYSQSYTITGYASLSPTANRQFISSAFNLLSLATPANVQPIGLIPVQLAGRVLVGQITKIEPVWLPNAPISLIEAKARHDITSMNADIFYLKWFDYDDLVMRTEYQEQKTPTSPQPNQSTPAQPSPPPL